jgi:hypothetical protein
MKGIVCIQRRLHCVPFVVLCALWFFSGCDSGGLLKITVLSILCVCCTAFCGVVEDCSVLGIPVYSSVLSEELLTVQMEGSLAMGDSLLKHYGGIFFLLADSIAVGWPIVGLQVDIPGASLILFREDVFSAVERMQQGLSESVLAGWILEHTWVTRSSL